MLRAHSDFASDVISEAFMQGWQPAPPEAFAELSVFDFGGFHANADDNKKNSHTSKISMQRRHVGIFHASAQKCKNLNNIDQHRQVMTI